jgi:thioredoxin 1
MASELLKTFTDANYVSDVINSDKLVVVDFWAEWCGPCRMVGPVLDELAAEVGDDVIIGKLNVDENNKTAQDFRVMSIPTIILYKDGQEAQRLVGVRSKEEYLENINKLK